MSQFTQREFLYLDDAMANAQNTAKCCQLLAEQCQQPQARQVCLNVSQMHNTHFQRLLRHLQAAQGKQGTQQQFTQQMAGNQFGQSQTQWQQPAFTQSPAGQVSYAGSVPNWSGNRNI